MITKPKKKLPVVQKKKLTPASICAQKAWGKMPLGVKKELRKTLKDRDKDGVPNGFDCRPKNKRKQEAFLSQDNAFLSSNSQIEKGNMLGRGTHGDVYDVVGNSDLIVKITNEYDDGSVDEEARLYRQCGMLSKPLFIPTEVRNMDGQTSMIRPKITPITDPSIRGKPSASLLNRMTPSVIENIRKQLEQLNAQGFVFADGIQIGLDKVGRPLLYDTGDIRMSTNKREVHHINNIEWAAFLIRIGKITEINVSGILRGFRKYGTIGGVFSSLVPITQDLIARNALRYEYD